MVRGRATQQGWIKGDDAIFVRDQAGPVTSCSPCRAQAVFEARREKLARAQAHREQHQAANNETAAV